MKNSSVKSFKQRSGLIAGALILAVALVFGGGASEIGLSQVVVIVVGLIGGASLLSDGSGLRRLTLPWSVAAIMVLILLLPLAQLIPLPSGIWRALPGREAEIAIIDLAGGAHLAHSLALNPLVNLQLFASLVVLMSFSLIVARLDKADFQTLLIIVLALAGFQFLLGLVQFSSGGQLLDIFGNSHKGWLLGTFANRNHTGLFFACCILISVSVLDNLNVKHRNFRLFYALGLMLLWLLATLATGSRTGSLLALLAIAFSLFLMIREIRLRAWIWIAGLVSLLCIGSGLLLSTRVQQLVERYATVGDDQRWSIWRNSLDLIGNYMPWGAGFGSFSAVYNKYEPLSELTPTYVNNAHNDYLELLVEAGLPGLVALVAVILIVILGVSRAVRLEDRSLARSAKIGGFMILLFAIHSGVDYPVRRMGTAIMLFLAFGLILRQFATDQKRIATH